MGAEPRSQREIIAKFESLRDEAQALNDTLSERKANAQEHALVLKTLEPLDKGRKCFKQTGDVLVERTVGDVLPDVRTNKQQLDQLVEHLSQTLQRKQKELLDFQKAFKIMIRDNEQQEQAQQPRAAASGQGVLVSDH